MARWAYERPKPPYNRFWSERLNALDESAWQTYNNGQEMTAHQLAKKLKSFGIKSKNTRQGQMVIKGFDKADFIKVWERYLPSTPNDKANPFLLE